MLTNMKRVASVAILILFSVLVVLPAMSFEMDYFPKFNVKQHFYVQKGSVSKNMDDAFFAEMEQRLVAIAKKYDTNIYFVCASSDQTSVDALSSSVLNYVQILWREWARQGMPTSKTVIVVLGGNNAEDQEISKFRAWAWFDTALKLPYLNSTAESTFAKSSSCCLEERNCPHHFVRTTLLHLEEECADIAAKQKAVEASKKALEEAAAEAAKIQATKASDKGSAGRSGFEIALSGIENMKREYEQKQRDMDGQLALVSLGLIAASGLLGWFLLDRPGSKTKETP